MPDTSTVAAIFSAVFFPVLFYLIYRVGKEAGEVRKQERDDEAALRASVKSRGWRWAPGLDRFSTLSWRIEGRSSDGIDFTLEHHLPSAPSEESAGRVMRRMVWTCETLKAPGIAFLIGGRQIIAAGRGEAGGLFVNGAIALLGGVATTLGEKSDSAAYSSAVAELLTKGTVVEVAELGARWTLVSRDEALVRRILHPGLCKAIAEFPRQAFANADTDGEFQVESGTRGLRVATGFISMGEEGALPRLAETLIALGNQIGRAVRAEREVRVGL